MSMQGKVVVVTGSNTGIGLETAVGVAALGATTVLACRNRAKAEAAAADVVGRTWNDDVSVVDLDLADLSSVRRAADEVLSRWGRLDVLVNNAGGTWTARQVTAQGFEYTFGVNHLGHFYFTSLLLDRLRESSPSRVVNVTSVGHHFAVEGHALRRPAERAALRRDGGVLPGQAGQRPLHAPAGPAPRRHGGHGERRPPRMGPQSLRYGRRPLGPDGAGDPAHSAPADQPGPRRVDLGLPGHVTWSGRTQWSVLGAVQARARGSPGAGRRRGRRLWEESERLLAGAGFAVT